MIDATLGLGGHSEHFLRTYPQLRLIALDRDPHALEIAGGRLAPFADRITFVHTRYDGIEDALAQAGLPAQESVHGILFDLGVSSMQLDESDRGFAYSIDAPLDMRMDPTTGITAARSSTRTATETSLASSARTARSASQARSRRRSSGSARRSRSPPAQRWSNCCIAPFLRRPAVPGDIRPSGRSRPFEWRSTASSIHCAPRSRQHSTR